MNHCRLCPSDNNIRYGALIGNESRQGSVMMRGDNVRPRYYMGKNEQVDESRDRSGATSDRQQLFDSSRFPGGTTCGGLLVETG